MPRQTFRRLPRIVQLLATSGLTGAAAGCLTAAALLASDTGGLATLFVRDGSPIVAGAMLFGSFALSFGSLAMGSAVMLLRKDD